MTNTFAEHKRRGVQRRTAKTAGGFRGECMAVVLFLEKPSGALREVECRGQKIMSLRKNVMRLVCDYEMFPSGYTYMRVCSGGWVRGLFSSRLRVGDQGLFLKIFSHWRSGCILISVFLGQRVIHGAGAAVFV